MPNQQAPAYLPGLGEDNLHGLARVRRQLGGVGAIKVAMRESAMRMHSFAREQVVESETVVVAGFGQQSSCHEAWAGSR